MRSFAFGVLAIFAVPLLAYPAALAAGIMGLAGYRTGKESMLLLIVSRVFLLGTLAYPIIYCYCAKATWNAGDQRAVIAWGLMPATYLGILWVLSIAWRHLEKSGA